MELLPSITKSSCLLQKVTYNFEPPNPLLPLGFDYVSPNEYYAPARDARVINTPPP